MASVFFSSKIVCFFSFTNLLQQLPHHFKNFKYSSAITRPRGLMEEK